MENEKMDKRNSFGNFMIKMLSNIIPDAIYNSYNQHLWAILW